MNITDQEPPVPTVAPIRQNRLIRFFLLWWRRHMLDIDRDATNVQVLEEGGFSYAYTFLVVASCGMATLGFMLNSAAVIIGAMLVAPPIGPIVLLGFAIAQTDIKRPFAAWRPCLSAWPRHWPFRSSSSRCRLTFHPRRKSWRAPTPTCSICWWQCCPTWWRLMLSLTKKSAPSPGWRLPRLDAASRRDRLRLGGGRYAAGGARAGSGGAGPRLVAEIGGLSRLSPVHWGQLCNPACP